MASSSKVHKSNKQVAEMILRVQGLNYDEWLDEHHVAIITKNIDVIGKVTQLALAKNLPDHSIDQSTQIKSEGGN